MGGTHMETDKDFAQYLFRRFLDARILPLALPFACPSGAGTGRYYPSITPREAVACLGAILTALHEKSPAVYTWFLRNRRTICGQAMVEPAIPVDASPPERRAISEMLRLADAAAHAEVGDLRGRFKGRPSRQKELPPPAELLEQYLAWKSHLKELQHVSCVTRYGDEWLRELDCDPELLDPPPGKKSGAWAKNILAALYGVGAKTIERRLTEARRAHK